MMLANKCQQLERLLHEQCPLLAIAILQLQALPPNKMMIATMNTLPHANQPNLAPFGSRRRIAR
jgi:hypothetical protein